MLFTNKLFGFEVYAEWCPCGDTFFERDTCIAGGYKTRIYWIGCLHLAISTRL